MDTWDSLHDTEAKRALCACYLEGIREAESITEVIHLLIRLESDLDTLDTSTPEDRYQRAMKAIG